MKIYGPTLECRNNHFPSEPSKHCQEKKKLIVGIYCVLLSYLVAHPRFHPLPILQACSMYF